MSKCRRCDLSAGCRHIRVGGDGAKDLGGEGVLFVGEAPGEVEDAQGKCFVGPTGRLLRSLVARYVGDRFPIRYTNAVRCYPGEADPVRGIMACRGYLLKEIERTNPGRIIALGRVATEALTDERLPITQIVGGFQRSSDITNVTTQFLLHPSACLHNPSLKPYFAETLKQAILRPPPEDWVSLNDTKTVSIRKEATALTVLERATGQRVVALDTEYNTRTNALLCLAIAWEPNKAFVFSDKVLKRRRVIAAFEKLLATTRMAGHNWKFDVWVLIKAMGIDPEIVLHYDNWWEDTLTYRKLDYPEQLANLDLCGWMVGMGGHKAELFGLLGTANKEVKTIGDRYEQAYYNYPEVVMRYCGWDTIATRRLVTFYERKMRREGHWQLWEEIFGPLGAALLQMEYNGLPVNREALDALDERFKAEMERELIAIRSSRVVKRLCANWDRDISSDEFNPKSAPQMRDLMFSKYGLDMKVREFTPTGLGKVDKHTVKAAKKRSPVVLEHISEFNRIKSKHGTFVKGYRGRIASDGALHTSYKQGGTGTHRLSSSDPNLQNVPNRWWEEDKAIRRCFIPHASLESLRALLGLKDDEWFLEVDYSQIEMRIGGDLSNDPVMMDCFRNEIDIHRKTAASVLRCGLDEVGKEQRQAAKPINFGTIFDMSEYGLKENAKKEYDVDLTVDEARMWRRGFFKLYRGYRAWMLREIASATKRGCAYTYWCGEPIARRWLPNLGSRDGGRRGHARRQAINTPVQGGAAMYMMKSLVLLNRMIKDGSLPGVTRLVHTIHDSVIVAVKRSMVNIALQRIGWAMVSHPTVRVPLEVEGKAGPTLADTKEIGVVSSLDAVRPKKTTIYITKGVA